MKTTKENIRQKYSILTANALHSIYGDADAYLIEFKKTLSNINRIAKKTKKNLLENELQEMLLNVTR